MEKFGLRAAAAVAILGLGGVGCNSMECSRAEEDLVQAQLELDVAAENGDADDDPNCRWAADYLDRAQGHLNQCVGSKGLNDSEKRLDGLIKESRLRMEALCGYQ